MRVLLLLAVAAATAWWAWPHLRALHAPLSQALPAMPSTPAAEGSATGLPTRCRLADGRLLYQQGACPSGSRTELLQGGSVNVLPAFGASTATPAASGGKPMLRDLADPEGAAELQRKRMEQISQ